ncbi:hypothetical protein FM104_10350 [Microbacterium esteraromaticum]|uniref:Uncharacterized protein n=1 Tax=Microbacterium esteraromaticum TaxID=57043 RepID=A0A1R4K4K3_9MICO|nr:hypothetical protein FM104_10350 [Microbacterium esteraromaticum]
MASTGDVRYDGIDGIRVAAQLDGNDLEHVLIDATGVDLTARMTEDGQSAGADTTPAEPPAIVSRTSGMLRTARIVAGPATVQGYAVHLDVTVSDAAFDWVEYVSARDAGRSASAFGIEDSPETARLSGSFSARMRASDIAPLIRAVATPMLATTGVRLRRLEGTVTVSRRQVVKVRALASVRWKIFGATVRAAVSVQITPAAIVDVKRVRLRSWNPIVAIALLAARRQVRAVEGQRFDLNEEAGATAPRISNLRLSAGDDLAISARFG